MGRKITPVKRVHNEITLTVEAEDPGPMFAAIEEAIEDGNEDVFIQINDVRYFLEIHEVST